MTTRCPHWQGAESQSSRSPPAPSRDAGRVLGPGGPAPRRRLRYRRVLPAGPDAAGSAGQAASGTQAVALRYRPPSPLRRKHATWVGAPLAPTRQLPAPSFQPSHWRTKTPCSAASCPSPPPSPPPSSTEPLKARDTVWRRPEGGGGGRGAARRPVQGSGWDCGAAAPDPARAGPALPCPAASASQPPSGGAGDRAGGPRPRPGTGRRETQGRERGRWTPPAGGEGKA